VGFGDQVKSFADKAKAQLEQAQQQAEVNARQRLVEILGDDAKLIRNLKLDLELGKFYEIDAPPQIIERLRAAGVVKGDA
jgi:hypothetical protein